MNWNVILYWLYCHIFEMKRIWGCWSTLSWTWATSVPQWPRTSNMFTSFSLMILHIFQPSCVIMEPKIEKIHLWRKKTHKALNTWKPYFLQPSTNKFWNYLLTQQKAFHLEVNSPGENWRAAKWRSTGKKKNNQIMQSCFQSYVSITVFLNKSDLNKHSLLSCKT